MPTLKTKPSSCLKLNMAKAMLGTYLRSDEMADPTLPDHELDRLFEQSADSGCSVDGVILAADYEDIQILHVSIGTKPIAGYELCLRNKGVTEKERKWTLVRPLYFLAT
jgi:hypothetical protein